jgi:hypothetical protein
MEHRVIVATGFGLKEKSKEKNLPGAPHSEYRRFELLPVLSVVEGSGTLRTSID